MEGKYEDFQVCNKELFRYFPIVDQSRFGIVENKGSQTYNTCSKTPLQPSPSLDIIFIGLAVLGYLFSFENPTPALPTSYPKTPDWIN